MTAHTHTHTHTDTHARPCIYIYMCARVCVCARCVCVRARGIITLWLYWNHSKYCEFAPNGQSARRRGQHSAAMGSHAHCALLTPPWAPYIAPYLSPPVRPTQSPPGHHKWKGELYESGVVSDNNFLSEMSTCYCLDDTCTFWRKQLSGESSVGLLRHHVPGPIIKSLV